MRKTILCITAVAAFAAMALPAVASTPSVTYTGQGWIDDGNGNPILKGERCGLQGQTPADDGGTGQFANWNGPGQPYQTGQSYLVWVLTLNANPAGGVTLHLPDGEHQMVKVGGTWKYASQYDSRDNLVALPAHATFSGAARNAQLVVSHGCKAFDQEKPAWCSPGYWGNAQDAAWALVGHSKAELFDTTVVPDFYATAYSIFRVGNGPSQTFVPDPTLIQVLENQGGVNSTVSGPFGINQFNAVGAYLTDDIPGYMFSGDISVHNCPIDNHGDLKVPQV